MKKLILIILFTFSAKAIWLTNGINPSSINSFGNITGSDMGDVCIYSTCYINTSTKENPILQYYKDIKLSGSNFDFYRNKDNIVYGKSGNYYRFATRNGDCTFIPVSSHEWHYGSYNIMLQNKYGNDITSDVFIDAAINSSGILKFGYGSGNDDSTPFSISFAEQFIKNQIGTLISIESGQKAWLADIDSDNEYEGIINSSSNIASYYELTTPTNWIYIGTCKNIQCFGDWDDDGLEDFMFYDGEVFLAVPEPVILHFLLIITIFFVKKLFKLHPIK